MVARVTRAKLARSLVNVHACLDERNDHFCECRLFRSLEVVGDAAQPVLIYDAHLFSIYLQNVMILHPGKYATDRFNCQPQIIADIGPGHRQAKRVG